jgi:hypothetical protein
LQIWLLSDVAEEVVPRCGIGPTSSVHSNIRLTTICSSNIARMNARGSYLHEALASFQVIMYIYSTVHATMRWLEILSC